MRVVYSLKRRGEAELEIYGETHTSLNLLTSCLNKKLVKGYSSYRIEHPLKQEAFLYIHSDDKEPKEALIGSLRDLIGDLEALEKRLNEAAGLRQLP